MFAPAVNLGNISSQNAPALGPELNCSPSRRYPIQFHGGRLHVIFIVRVENCCSWFVWPVVNPKRGSEAELWPVTPCLVDSAGNKGVDLEPH